MIAKKLVVGALCCLICVLTPVKLPGATAGRSTIALSQRPRPWDRVKEIPVGSTAPNWKLETAENKTVVLSELRSMIVVLDFWANWCGPCRKLEPVFDKLVSEYKQKSVAFLTISIWPDKDFDSKTYLSDHNISSTFLNGDDKVAADYGIWGVPTYFVIDRKGSINYIHVLLSVDPDALERRLRTAIEQALAKPAE